MNESFRFEILQDHAGGRLDDFIASRFGRLSRTRIGNLIRSGHCLVNQDPAPPGRRLIAGDEIEISLSSAAPTAPTAMAPEPAPLEIVYEDDHILVLVKPADLLVHPTRNVKSGTLANALAYYLNRDFFGREEPHQPADAFDDQAAPNGRQRFRSPPDGDPHSLTRPGLVHRLDRATSGLMVIAKTRAALSRLSSHFQRRLIEKRYLALVHGRFQPESGAIVAPIERDENRQPHWWVSASGKPAETRFRTLDGTGSASLIELEPVTGRTNQLRIHCAYAGHPIIGDDLYGGLRWTRAGQESLRQPKLLTAESEAGRLGNASEPRISMDATRLCLHANRLAFHHPATGEWMSFTSPIPEHIAQRMTCRDRSTRTSMEEPLSP